MRRTLAVFSALCVAAAFAVSLSASNGTTAPQSIDDMIQDKVEVWVELDVSNLNEHRFTAGYPPRTVRSTTDISFRRAGVWTFARLKPKFGGGYRAFPGRLPKTEFPSVSNVAVTASHPCQDGEGQVIGRETVHPTAKVHPALGGIQLFAAPGGRVRIHLMPSQIDVDHVECSHENCNAGFASGWITLGENPETTVEDEDGYEEVGGYDLGEYDWDSLKALAKGGELELTLPLAAEGVQREDYEDPPGYAASNVETYHVKGWIRPLAQDGFFERRGVELFAALDRPLAVRERRPDAFAVSGAVPGGVGGIAVAYSENVR